MGKDSCTLLGVWQGLALHQCTMSWRFTQPWLLVTAVQRSGCSWLEMQQRHSLHMHISELERIFFKGVVFGGVYYAVALLVEFLEGVVTAKEDVPWSANFHGQVTRVLPPEERPRSGATGNI